MKKDRNIAELALGNAFKNLKTGEKPAEEIVENTLEKKELKPIDPNQPLSYNNCEGFTPITYAEIIPNYHTFNKNKKKKLRTKNQKKLDEANSKKFEEFKAQNEKPEIDFHPQIEEIKGEEETKELSDKEAEGEGNQEEKPKSSAAKGPKIDERVVLKI